MIATDQPSCFPPELLVVLSSKDDGTMKTGGVPDEDVRSNRIAFCKQAGVDYDDVVFQYIVYDNTQTYNRMVEVSERDTVQYTSGVSSDGLFTTTPGIGMLLPVADCVATVVYDPVRRYLALLHLGRHSSLTDLIARAVAYFTNHGSSPADLIVWMSPNIHQSHYRMEYFDNENDAGWQPFIERRSDGIYIDMQGHNKQRFIDAGVLAENIYESPHNTATNTNYFSHSQGDSSGRFAVLVMLKP